MNEFTDNLNDKPYIECKHNKNPCGEVVISKGRGICRLGQSTSDIKKLERILKIQAYKKKIDNK